MKIPRITITLLIIPLLLLVIAGGFQYWSGRHIEKVFNENLDRLSEKGFRFVKRSYDRGWLRSSAQSSIDIPMGGTILEVIHEIDHGPVLFKEFLQGNFRLASIKAHVESRVILGIKGVGISPLNLPSFQANWTINLDGDVESSFNVPAFKGSPDMPVKIDWQGLSGNLHYRRAPESFKGALTVLPLNIDYEESSLFIDNVISEIDLFRGPAGLTIGNTHISIGSIQIKNKKDRFVFNDLKFSTQTDVVGDNLRFILKKQIEEIRLADDNYGPAFIEFQVNNLDAYTLARLQQLRLELQNKGAKEQMEINKQMMGLVSDLLKKVPRIEITRLTLDTSDGKVDGSLKLIIDGSQADISQNPALLLTAIGLNARLKVPVPIMRKVLLSQAKDKAKKVKPTGHEIGEKETELLAQTVDHQLETWVKEEYIVEDGADYKVNVTFKQGRLLVNGRPMDQALPMLMMQGAPSEGLGGIDTPGFPDEEIALPLPPEVSIPPSVVIQEEPEEIPEPVVKPSLKRQTRKTPVSRSDIYRLKTDIRILKDQNRRWIERNLAARRLGLAMDKRAVDPLIHALGSDQDPFVRREAALSLWKLGDKRAIEPLTRALNDENEWVSKFAAKALQKLTVHKKEGYRPWAVHIASYVSRAEAEDLAKDLRLAGYNTYITEFDLEGVRWYRLRAGFYSSEEEAGRYSGELYDKFDIPAGAWVVKPSKKEVMANRW